jgi:hypothetical protein
MNVEDFREAIRARACDRTGLRSHGVQSGIEEPSHNAKLADHIRQTLETLDANDAMEVLEIARYYS